MGIRRSEAYLLILTFWPYWSFLKRIKLGGRAWIQFRAFILKVCKKRYVHNIYLLIKNEISNFLPQY